MILLDSLGKVLEIPRKSSFFQSFQQITGLNNIMEIHNPSVDGIISKEGFRSKVNNIFGFCVLNGNQFRCTSIYL